MPWEFSWASPFRMQFRNQRTELGMGVLYFSVNERDFLFLFSIIILSVIGLY